MTVNAIALVSLCLVFVAWGAGLVLMVQDYDRKRANLHANRRRALVPPRNGVHVPAGRRVAVRLPGDDEPWDGRDDDHLDQVEE